MKLSGEILDCNLYKSGSGHYRQKKEEVVSQVAQAIGNSTKIPFTWGPPFSAFSTGKDMSKKIENE